MAIKEASGNMVQCMELLQNKPEGFTVLSGDDNLVLAQMALGMEGIISVAANCFTKHNLPSRNRCDECFFEKSKLLIPDYLNTSKNSCKKNTH